MQCVGSEYRGAVCEEVPFAGDGRWPTAARGDARSRFAVGASMWPAGLQYLHLLDLRDLGCVTPPSERATGGFLSRLEAGGFRVTPEAFRLDAKRHLAPIEPVGEAGA